MCPHRSSCTALPAAFVLAPVLPPPPTPHPRGCIVTTTWLWEPYTPNAGDLCWWNWRHQLGRKMFVLELAPKKGRPISPYKVKSAQKQSSGLGTLLPPRCLGAAGGVGTSHWPGLPDSQGWCPLPSHQTRTLGTHGVLPRSGEGSALTKWGFCVRPGKA